MLVNLPQFSHSPEALMHLTRRKAFLLLAISLAACTESTAPRTVSAEFRLNDINGRTLPTYQAATPGLTATIITGNLTLDNAGQAVMIEQRQQFDGTDITLSTTYKYEIRGNEIVFSMLQPCPANANCVAPPKGAMSPITGQIALEIGLFGSEPIIYNFYRLMLD
jgi:hypothetical protein